MSFVAISRVHFPPAQGKEVTDVGLRMLPIARRQPGLLSIAIHRSRESSSTMIYWEWESPADHEACLASDDWAELMEEAKGALEGTEFSIETFDRLG